MNRFVVSHGPAPASLHVRYAQISCVGTVPFELGAGRPGVRGEASARRPVEALSAVAIYPGHSPRFSHLRSRLRLSGHSRERGPGGAILHALPLSAEFLPLLIFVMSGLCISAVTEALRTTLEKHSEAKAYADVLMMELAHRTRNDLATIMSILRLQARSDSNPAVQAAITSALARMEVVAKVHDRLRETAVDSTVDLAAYLEALCGSLADFHRGVRPISIRVSCGAIAVKSSQAASIGLIVNELVTNAFKYAFPEGRTGTVEVDVRTRNGKVVITVRDNGIGCPAEAKSGLGTRLINLMTAQMKGSMTRTPMAQGCEVQVVVVVES